MGRSIVYISQVWIYIYLKKHCIKINIFLSLYIYIKVIESEEALWISEEALYKNKYISLYIKVIESEEALYGYIYIEALYISQVWISEDRSIVYIKINIFYSLSI